MTVKHTPGPWMVIEEGAVPVVAGPGGAVHVPVILGHAESALGDMLQMVPGSRWANAKLVAAAPDLLELAYRVIEFCEAEESGWPSPTTDELYTMARAAVNKVK